MKKFFQIGRGILCVALLALFPGCVSPQRVYSFTDGSKKRTDLFKEGEIQGVAVEFPGQTVKVQLYDISRGKIIEEKDAYIPSGKRWLLYADLSPGFYKVDVFVGGARSATTMFAVE